MYGPIRSRRIAQLLEWREHLAERSAVAGPNRLVPLGALTSSELTEGALRTAANRGRLRAQKGADGQWRSTRAWVDEYLASRHQRSYA